MRAFYFSDIRSNVVRYCDFWEFKNEDDNFAQHADVTMIQVAVITMMMMMMMMMKMMMMLLLLLLLLLLLVMMMD